MFFDNATVASVIAVLIASFLGIKSYEKQKNNDRDNIFKKEIVDYLLVLQSSINTVHLIIDRIAYSYEITERNHKDFFIILEKYEIPRLSDEINDKIPKTRDQISTKLKLFFGDNILIKKEQESLFIFLKEWHEPIVKMERSLKERISKNDENKINKIDKKIQEIIKLVYKEKIII